MTKKARKIVRKGEKNSSPEATSRQSLTLLVSLPSCKLHYFPDVTNSIARVRADI